MWDPNTITQLLQPVAGIERVTNLDPTQKAAEDESDEALRKRAKAKLRGLNLCTLAAIEQAAREARADDVEIRDPQYPTDQPDKWTPAGVVQVLIKGDPARFEAVRGAIDGVRAAGVLVQVIARLVYFKLRLQVQIDPGITPIGQNQIKLDIIAAVTNYVNTLSSGDAISGAELNGRCCRSQRARSPNCRCSSTAGCSGMATDPDNPDQPDQRVPRRDLVVHDGEPATDEQIQAWEFVVLTEVNGQKALPVLDFTPDDIEVKT